jgi:predicted nuclease of predicted toxin-antitoxin system
MKLLLDENIEKAITTSLRESGYDVICVSETACGCSDEEVLRIANEERRILVTSDTDFGEMIFRQGKTCYGLVLLRFASEKVNDKIRTLQHLLKHHSGKLSGHFTVASAQQIRIKPMDS